MLVLLVLPPCSPRWALLRWVSFFRFFVVDEAMQKQCRSNAETETNTLGELQILHSRYLIQKHLNIGGTGTQILLGLELTFTSLIWWLAGLKTILGIRDLFFFSRRLKVIKYADFLLAVGSTEALLLGCRCVFTSSKDVLMNKYQWLATSPNLLNEIQTAKVRWGVDHSFPSSLGPRGVLLSGGGFVRRIKD